LGVRVSRVEETGVETTTYSLASAPPAREDRREGERHVTLFRVGSLMIGDRQELCLIRNISAGGMLIRAYCAIPPGTRLSVELKCGQSASGMARWAEGNSVGVVFDQPMDIVDLLSPAGKGPRPRMPRVEIDCLANVRQEAQINRARALNISQGGLRLSCRRPLEVGGAVIVTLAGLSPQQGMVRWNDGECFGVTFNKVLPLPLLISWLQDQQQRLRAAG
jgi:hypothetical protein